MRVYVYQVMNVFLLTGDFALEYAIRRVQANQ
jgi:hypothetical protein